MKREGRGTGPIRRLTGAALRVYTVPMAGGTKRRPAKARARARPRRPALGNDPFERGAAPREPAATSGPTADANATASGAAAPFPPAPPAREEARRPGDGVTSAAAKVGGGASVRLAGIERRLDAAIGGLESRVQDLAERSGLAGARGELREAIARLLPALKGRLAAAIDVVRLIEPPDRLDPFGMDARFAERLDALVELLYAGWWRVAVRDVEHVPASGPGVVIANHAGAVPWDAFVLRHALRREHPFRRELRPLLDDAECALPVIGAAAIRYGAVRASADAAERILSGGGLVGVFPEGSAVARKPWRDRYRIHGFGRGGFAKVALRAGAPIVPCAIVGSEEASPGISRTGWLAERLHMPLLSANPALRLGAAALLPLPSRWTLRFGEPIDVLPYGSDAAADGAVVNAITEQVRSTLQGMLDEGVAARSSVFL